MTVEFPKFENVTDDVHEAARRINMVRDHIVDKNIEEGKMDRVVWEAQATCHNPVTRVYFRAGLLACREYMARFVEAQSKEIAQSIRANWWPTLGDDPGVPRLLNFDEVANGGDEGPWTQKDPGPNIEALPVAAQFLSVNHLDFVAEPFVNPKVTA